MATIDASISCPISSCSQIPSLCVYHARRHSTPQPITALLISQLEGDRCELESLSSKRCVAAYRYWLHGRRLCTRYVRDLGVAEKGFWFSGKAVDSLLLTLYGHIKTTKQRTIIQYRDWYTVHWWWVVTFGRPTARRSLCGLRPCLVPSSLYTKCNSPPINS